ncbi:MAG: SDR family oxidoreductase [Bacteroidota bacterium]
MNILVTGGASGLGEAITRILAKNPDNSVFFTYSSSDKGAKNIESSFDNATAFKCNFRDQVEVSSLVDKIESLDLDVLINNAFTGEAIKTYFHKMEQGDFSEDFLNNLIPTIRITQEAIIRFRKKKSGKIITILTSFLTNVPPLGSSSYVASKAYLGSLVKSWANENIKFNISSNAVSPSFMQTQLTSEVDERIIDQMTAEHPLKKLLTVEEVADAVLYLTKASRQINGLDLLINHGSNLK